MGFLGWFQSLHSLTVSVYCLGLWFVCFSVSSNWTDFLGAAGGVASASSSDPLDSP